MTEVKNEIERYTHESSEEIHALTAELDDLKNKHSVLLKENESKGKTQLEQEKKRADEISEKDHELKNLQNTLKRIKEEQNSEQMLNQSKIDSLINENTNLKTTLEKKTKSLEHYKSESKANEEKLQALSEEAQAQYKAKDDALNKLNAKFDYEVAILNEKAKYSDMKYAEMQQS